MYPDRDPTRNVSRYNNQIPIVRRAIDPPHPRPVFVRRRSSLPIYAIRRDPPPSVIMARVNFIAARNQQAQPRLPEAIQPPDPEEANCEQYFSGLFTKYIFNLLKTLIVCLILMMFTQIMQFDLDTASIPLVILCVLNELIYLIAIRFTKTTQSKIGIFLRWLQCVAIIIFLLSLKIIHNKPVNNASAALYIVFYAINIGHDFMTSKFTHKYITKIKKVLLLMRVCIVLQLILILIQINLNTPITWFAVFFPLYILVFILLFCTIVLIKNVFVSHRAQFWITEVSNKKKGIAWILANLFVLQAILLYGTIHASFVLNDDRSNYTGPFLPLCISINLSCLASLFLIEQVKDGVPKVFKALSILSTAVANHAPVPVQEERYVIKISNTYFKMATEQDIKQLKSKKKYAKSGDSDVEIGLKRMATEMGMCIICCKDMSDGVFMGCGHGGICFECGKRIIKLGKECHMCREKIRSILKVEIDTKKILYKILDELNCES